MPILKNNTALLTILLVVVQIGLCVVVIMTRQYVPTHWNIHGVADEYGSPFYTLILPLISVLIYFFMTFFEKHPHYCNWPQKFKDRQKGYSLISKLVAWLKLLIMMFLAFVTYEVYCGGSFNYLIALLILITSFIVIIVYAIKLRRV